MRTTGLAYCVDPVQVARCRSRSGLHSSKASQQLGVKRLPSEAPPGGGSAAAAAAAAARSAAESGGPLSAAHGIALMNRLGPTGWSHSVLSVRQSGLQEAGGSFEGQHVARVRVCVHSGDGPRRGKVRTRFVSS